MVRCHCHNRFWQVERNSRSMYIDGVWAVFREEGARFEENSRIGEGEKNWQLAGGCMRKENSSRKGRGNVSEKDWEEKKWWSGKERKETPLEMKKIWQPHEKERLKEHAWRRKSGTLNESRLAAAMGRESLDEARIHEKKDGQHQNLKKGSSRTGKRKDFLGGTWRREIEHSRHNERGGTRISQGESKNLPD